ncbi:hypothetical protein [uncultured Endozoicomonas sp.]|uniref:hypothetical protein n=1 Tax=uncultured Endozoicomonas sp. TaxID=432652 RepID=UPI00260A2DB7|nr:hypothetical protein [uncultured Endozoicomonas sp.]
MPLYMVREFPAEEILYQRSYDQIEQKELEDAQLIAKGKPPKHYPLPEANAEHEARKQYAAWANAFDI